MQYFFKIFGRLRSRFLSSDFGKQVLIAISSSKQRTKSIQELKEEKEDENNRWICSSITVNILGISINMQTYLFLRIWGSVLSPFSVLESCKLKSFFYQKNCLNGKNKGNLMFELWQQHSKIINPRFNLIFPHNFFSFLHKVHFH